MLRLLASATVLAVCLLGLTGRGGDDPADVPTTPVTVDIKVSGDTITPHGERVEAAVGQKIALVVDADAPGEIHVHSDPEQVLEYDAGTTTLDLAPIDKPGLVDVESHTLDVVIVQLEVS